MEPRDRLVHVLALAIIAGLLSIPLLGLSVLAGLLAVALLRLSVLTGLLLRLAVTTGLLLRLTVLAGLLFRYSQDFFGYVSLDYDFSPLLAAGLPIAACLLVGGVAVARLR